MSILSQIGIIDIHDSDGDEDYQTLGDNDNDSFFYETDESDRITKLTIGDIRLNDDGEEEEDSDSDNNDISPYELPFLTSVTFKG